MPLYPYFVNTYQQTPAVQHKNTSKIPTTISQHVSSYGTIIQSCKLQKKTIRHSNNPFEFTLPKIQQFIHKQHQHQMSKLLISWTLKTDLTSLWMLYFTWFNNLEELNPNHKTFWFNFVLEKEYHYQNSIF